MLTKSALGKIRSISSDKSLLVALKLSLIISTSFAFLRFLETVRFQKRFLEASKLFLSFLPFPLFFLSPSKLHFIPPPHLFTFSFHRRLVGYIQMRSCYHFLISWQILPFLCIDPPFSIYLLPSYEY